jgi:glycine/D-amino acid oxidase-like deaminating enzyme
MKVSQTPTWIDSYKKAKKYPQLKKDLEVDVAIIGGGITGVTTAYLLPKSKKKVALIEKGTLGESGATGMTTAFLSQSLMNNISDNISLFGKREAKLIWDSHLAAIDTIEKIVKKEKIDCDFSRCPDYVFGNDEKQFQGLEEELDAAKSIGIHNLKILGAQKLPFTNAGVLVYQKQGKFHPLKYLTQLAKIASDNGVQIFENTEALEVTEKSPFVIRTPNGKITAKYVVIATYNPFNQPSEIFLRKGTYTTYILEAEIPKSIFEDATYEDDDNPYHYFRVDPQPKFDRIIIGGEDHRAELKGLEKESFKSLEKYLKQILGYTKYTITRKWMGPIVEPVDGIGVIGPVKKASRQSFSASKMLVATGLSGNGMTYGTISALIFRDIILGKKNTWAPVYKPSRPYSPKQLAKKGIDYSEEFLGGAAKNYLHKIKK